MAVDEVKPQETTDQTSVLETSLSTRETFMFGHTTKGTPFPPVIDGFTLDFQGYFLIGVLTVDTPTTHPLGIQNNALIEKLQSPPTFSKSYV